MSCAGRSSDRPRVRAWRPTASSWTRSRPLSRANRAGCRGRPAHLPQAAADWQERGRDRADLYRGARLAVAREWRASHADELRATEREFLDASETAAEREQRRLRLALVGVVALLAVATLGAIVALHQRGAAQRQART